MADSGFSKDATPKSDANSQRGAKDMRSPCHCEGPPRVLAAPKIDYRPGATLAAGGAATSSAAKAAEALTRHDFSDLQRLGSGLFGVGATLLAIEATRDLMGVVLSHEGIHAWDVRNDTPERRARFRQMADDLSRASLQGDAADYAILQEKLVTVIQHNAIPDDTCGWYRFGWATQNHIMEAILEDSGLGAALAFAAAKDDAAILMRLAGIPPEQVGCTRFWFGIRDSNHNLAQAIANSDDFCQQHEKTE